jgi:hypothetical protein
MQKRLLFAILVGALLTTVLTDNTWQDIRSWPDPIETYMTRFLKQLEQSSVTPTDITRKDYLKAIAGGTPLKLKLT